MAEDFNQRCEDTPFHNDWAVPGALWDQPAPEGDWIRSFRIAHNTTTIYEPCCRCGAVYYRGPFHIVQRDTGILCWECAAKIPFPLARIMQEYLDRLQLWTFAEPCENNTGTFHILTATQPFSENQTPLHCEHPPGELMDGIKQLCRLSEELECFVIYFIKGRYDNYFPYTAKFTSGPHGAGSLVCGGGTLVDGFLRENRAVFSSVEYLLLQRIIPAHPYCPILLRSQVEWRSL